MGGGLEVKFIRVDQEERAEIGRLDAFTSKWIEPYVQTSPTL